MGVLLEACEAVVDGDRGRVGIDGVGDWRAGSATRYAPPDIGPRVHVPGDTDLQDNAANDPTAIAGLHADRHSSILAARAAVGTE